MEVVNLHAMNHAKSVGHELFLSWLFVAKWHSHGQLLDQRPWKSRVLLPSLLQQDLSQDTNANDKEIPSKSST
jgi:hypothetical protein